MHLLENIFCFTKKHIQKVDQSRSKLNLKKLKPIDKSI